MTRPGQDKVDVEPASWDTVFAPSSALVMITTVDAAGRTNAASYGTCVRVNHDPVDLAFTCNLGSDTDENVLDSEEFVVNLVSFDPTLLAKVLEVGLPWKRGIDELEKASLTPIPARVVAPPRIAECYAHFEMKVEWTRAWSTRRMVCGRTVAVSANADCGDEDGLLVWAAARPAHYCGGRYADRFVPAYQPVRADWDWRDLEARGVTNADFRRSGEGVGDPVLVDLSDWRDLFRSEPRE